MCFDSVIPIDAFQYLVKMNGGKPRLSYVLQVAENLTRISHPKLTM
jgi:hypothetical protein